MPVVGAVAMGLVWGAVCARITFARRPVVDGVALILSAAAVVAAALWVTGRPAAGIAAGAAIAAGWILRRMVEGMIWQSNRRR
jgi:hypothetical protein